MFAVKELFKDNRYPAWIKTHAVFSEIAYIRKVFPSLGLPNFECKQLVDNSKNISSYAIPLLNVMYEFFHKRIQKLQKFSKNGKIGKDRRQKLDLLIKVMSELGRRFQDNKEAHIVFTESGKADLVLSDNLFGDKGKAGKVIFAKKGAGLFRLYGKIHKLLLDNRFVGLPDLNKSYQFKNFSSVNIPAKYTTVKFTSEGAEGIWDIATMSMRGISSCQTWDEGVGNGAKVVGSMIDPFTAIIYLTTGEQYNTFGSKMIRRCIVRYVIDREGNKPYLLLEKMYPALNEPTLNTFVTAIRDRSKDLPVFYSGDIGVNASTYGSKISQSYIPLAEELKKIQPQFYPYVDTHIPFVADDKCKLSKIPEEEKDSIKFEDEFKDKIANTILDKMKSIKMGDYGYEARAFWKQMQGKPVCICVNSTCTKEHSKFKAQVKSELIVNSVGQILTDYILEKSRENKTKPIPYFNEQKQACIAFLASEMSKRNKIEKEFTNLFSNKLINSIEI